MGMYGKLAAIDPDDIDTMRGWGYEETMGLFESPSAVDLDKTWDVVFRLIGHIAGTGMMVADNAQPIGEELVYGPAMYVDADTVKIMAMQLGGLDDEQVADAWAQIGVEDTYPMGVAAEEPEWFLERFTDATALIAQAAHASRVLAFVVT